MKREHKKMTKLNLRENQSIFNISQDDLKDNILKYNTEKNRVHQTIDRIDFKNYWVV